MNLDQLMRRMGLDDLHERLQMAQVVTTIFDKLTPEMQHKAMVITLGQATGAGFDAMHVLLALLDNYGAETKAACDQLDEKMYEGLQDVVRKFRAGELPGQKREPDVLTMMRPPKDEKGN